MTSQCISSKLLLTN